MGKAFQMMERHGIGAVRRKYQAWGRAIAECAESKEASVGEAGEARCREYADGIQFKGLCLEAAHLRFVP